MELEEIEPKIQAFLEKRRPPEKIRNQVDIGYSYKDRALEIFEIRPVFMKPGEKVQIPIARAKYIVSGEKWKVYWMRSNGKWIAYEPVPEVWDVAEFLELVDQDRYACFWG